MNVLQPPPPPAVVARGLTKTVGGRRDVRTVLDGVTLRVADGEWLAVTGRSGSGKSTLLHLLGGLDRPTAGSVTIAGTDISAMSESARARFRRAHVGIVFQRFNLVEDLTVAGNVELPLVLAGWSGRAARARVASLLDGLGLGDRGRASVGRLSGGEQQRVAVARALAARPAVLLADEPTGALDSRAARAVVDLLVDAHRAGQTIVMVTHDPDVAGAADRVVRLADGAVLDEPVGGSGRADGAPLPGRLVAGVAR